MYAQSVDFMISFDLFFVCFIFSVFRTFSIFGLFPFFLFLSLFSFPQSTINLWVKVSIGFFLSLRVFACSRTLIKRNNNVPPLLGVAAAGLDLSNWWSLICILVYNADHKFPATTRIMCFIIYHNKLVECHVIGRQWRRYRRETMESSRVWWWIPNSGTRCCCCWPAVVFASVTLRPIEFRLEFSSDDRLNLFNFFLYLLSEFIKKMTI